MVDDIVDSGGTLCNAAAALKEHGATEVHAYVVHGVLSGTAVDKIAASSMESLVISDSIQATPEVENCSKIIRLSVAELIGEGIKRISEERSISALFK
jgi:ribose-phosphate pyrophosphokinase